jgi:hypothetical protein
MTREVVEIRIDERGHETHESWVVIRANRGTTMGSVRDGARLFGSEIPHSSVITVTVARCSRERSLYHDHLYHEKTLLEVDMSEAQWGAFVSSFGQGTGVPATLKWLSGVGRVPAAPAESRLDESLAEVRAAGDRSLAGIAEALEEVEAAFEAGGRRLLREKLRTLHYAVANAPSNMEFAAESLAEHAENVVTKAKADIEGMVLAAAERGELNQSIEVFELPPGADADIEEGQ